MRVGCCTITTLQRDPSKEYSDPLSGWGYKGDEFASGHHLKGGIQRDWGFEDIQIANGDVSDIM
jgi:transcription factor C subunit 7